MPDLLVLQLLIAAIVPVVFLLAIEAGYRVGRRRTSDSKIDTGPIQGAILGLLGLLLAFSFAGSAGRFVERQHLVYEDANAIGTAVLRADLLPDPYADGLRDTLREYTEHRAQTGSIIRGGELQAALARVPEYHNRMWAIARDGVAEAPGSTVVVINAVNDVIDTHTLRVASNRHLQTPVLGLLVICSLLTLGIIGFTCGMAGARNAAMTTVIALLIASTLLITLDLDNGRVGLIRISDAPLEELSFDRVPSAQSPAVSPAASD